MIHQHQWLQQAIAAGTMQARLVAYISFVAYILRLHGRNVEFIGDEIIFTV